MIYLRLLILLMMSVPQAFLPLLHAHLGRDRSPAVLHLPGLERYYQVGDPEVGPERLLPSWKGVIVRSDDGVRPLKISLTSAAILPGTVPPLAEREEVEQSFKAVQASSQFWPILLPRAPPA